MLGITGNLGGVIPGDLYGRLGNPGIPACKKNVRGIFLLNPAGRISVLVVGKVAVQVFLRPGLV